MSVLLKFRDQEFKVQAGMTVRDTLLKIMVAPESVLITRNGELITDDEILHEGDEIKLIAVISGG
ncbi:MAG: hypothetical protein A2Z14_04865 [Chloroflexi bacterium RBG_16_48_8]|nr:MAG: hypothetical protein A2Z14_04865 [Chloroflexi bacterium RBG_16_48_8]